MPSNLYLHWTLVYLGTSVFIHLSINSEKKSGFQPIPALSMRAELVPRTGDYQQRCLQSMAEMTHAASAPGSLEQAAPLLTKLQHDEDHRAKLMMRTSWGVQLITPSASGPAQSVTQRKRPL